MDPPGDCGRPAGNSAVFRLGDGAVECYFHRGNGIRVKDVSARRCWEHQGLPWANGVRGFEGEAVLADRQAEQLSSAYFQLLKPFLNFKSHKITVLIAQNVAKALIVDL